MSIKRIPDMLLKYIRQALLAVIGVSGTSGTITRNIKNGLHLVKLFQSAGICYYR